MKTSQKKSLIFCAVLVVILVLVTTLSWTENNTTKVAMAPVAATKNDMTVAEAQAYLNYLNNLPVDSAASQQEFQTIFSQTDVQQQISDELAVNATVTPPAVTDSSIKTTTANSQNSVVAYLTNTVGPVNSFNESSQSFNEDLFDQTTDSAGAIMGDYNSLKSTLANVTVPTVAKQMQKDLLQSYYAYGNLLQTSSDYANQKNDNPWPQVYQDYAVINQARSDYDQQFNALSNKYQLASLPPVNLQYAAEKFGKGFALIPKAQAVFGLGDTTAIIANIPQIILQGVEEGVTSALVSFTAKFVTSFVNQVEKNYAIANFLYYGDAVDSVYEQDYLNKNVSNNADAQMVKLFLPQLSCGTQTQAQYSQLQTYFQAKATTYLGFNPSTLSPSDPSYYTKLAKIGDWGASSQEWMAITQDTASQALAAAQQSANLEMTSSGIKSAHNSTQVTPRSAQPIQSDITKSINLITGSETQALNAIWSDIGTGTGQYPAAVSLVSTLVQGVMNNFVFSGLTNVSVLKEQTTCLAAAQPQVIVSGGSSNSLNIPSSVTNTQSQVIQQACANDPADCKTIENSGGSSDSDSLGNDEPND